MKAITRSKTYSAPAAQPKSTSTLSQNRARSKRIRYRPGPASSLCMK